MTNIISIEGYELEINIIRIIIKHLKGIEIP